MLSAHPRLRGEHRPRELILTRRGGSSPLTRGAQNFRRPDGNPRRLIPAYAGSTLRSCPTGRTARAHPRLRGEHRGVAVSDGTKAGSSPLTRGALSIVAIWGRVSGLIPAYAGSTDSWVSRPGCSWAHPRLRGEHSSASSSNAAGWGSSPLTRGALRMSAISSPFPRLIPAYAGSTG